jgi:hypothetical protein
MRLFVIAAVASAVLAGCGSSEPKEASAPALDTVLDCLKVNGLDAKDQSTSTGDKIGIDYDAGRLVISFEDSAEDAESYASAAESSGDAAFVKGTVAVTVPQDPEAEGDRAAVEECVG